MKTLALFNAVIAGPITSKEPFISDEGYVIEPQALWAKDKIVAYYKAEKLSGNDLNKTFHKSWDKIKNSSRLELAMEQIRHYLSTYGSNFTSEMYIPNEVLELPDIKLSYKVIKAYEKEEMVEKCLNMLKSGIALKSETITDLLSILVDELDYTFTGSEGIRNKEAIIMIADMYNVLPSDTMEFFRYIIYRATNETLLIKNDKMIMAIQHSSFNPTTQFKEHGVEKLAQIFNRFKPLFLAFKPRAGKTINKIAKLAKKYHKPMVSNPLNMVSSVELTKADTHWLDNATPFALFRALNVCHVRMNGKDSFVYRIRNGKSFTKENDNNVYVAEKNFKFILNYIKGRFDLSGTKVYLPEGVEYALPSSEKMFVGNIPTGTCVTGEKLAVGMYWENDWGARDLDLSGLNIGGKIGWNASYNQGNDQLLYSGDITNAPNGAVEYLYANSGLSEPTLVMINTYSGAREGVGYKIIVGKGDKMSYNYMMNPNNLISEAKAQSYENQMVLGMLIPNGKTQRFVYLNFGAGSARVSGWNETTAIATKALFQDWSNPYTFQQLLVELGATIIDNKQEANYDFSIDNLEKDSFTKIFEAETSKVNM